MLYRSPPLQTIPTDIVATADYERYAHERMSPEIWAWLSGGATDELTLRNNSAAFARLRLRSRVLRDLRGGHTRLTLYGCNLEYPILLAPIAYHHLVHPQGELATVLGASALKASMVVSTKASTSLEDIAAAAQTHLWFQLYIQAERGFTRELISRVEQAGYRALVVTVDAPISGIRNREQRTGFALPTGIEAVNLRGLPTLPAHWARPGDSPLFGSPLLALAPQWQDLEWLCGATRLPVLVKGILSPEDAVSALDCGAAGVIVSNHGGRTLDSLPASIEALPGVVEAVAGRAPILLDGGIRRGGDIFKAIALGAAAVLIGRPYMYALATAGAPGIAHVLNILRAELEATMVLTGCRTLADIDGSRLLPRPG